MKSWSKYTIVYKTNLLHVSEKYVQDPVKVIVFDGPKKIKTPYRLARIIPSGEESSIMNSSEFEVGLGKFIAFEARSKNKHLPTARTECEKAINNAITTISITHTSDIFDQVVYAGWLEDESKINVESWIKISKRQSINRTLLETTTQKINMLDVSARERFQLMSRLYNKSLTYDPGEEKFLLLWTILEVFPMMGQTQYHPIATYLSPILKRDPANIADSLDIKGIHSLRSKLIHSGRFDLDYEQTSELVGRLELVIRSVMREMADLDYDGSLDDFLK